MSLGNCASYAVVNITLDVEVTAKCLGKHTICTRFPDARPLPHFSVHFVDQHLENASQSAVTSIWHFICYYFTSEVFQICKRRSAIPIFFFLTLKRKGFSK